MDEKKIPMENEAPVEQVEDENQEPLEMETADEDILTPDQMKKRKKKIAKRIVIVCIAIVALYGLFTWLVPQTCFEQEMPPIPVDQNIYLYEPDWDVHDITIDPEYAELDHRVHFYDADSGATYSLEEEDLPTASAELRFFYEYFQSLIWGDEERYADCFASDYEGTYEIPEKFTPQMVYDIHIEPYFSETAGEDTYKVFYKIAKNNGTFRDDIGEIGGVDVGCDLLVVLSTEGNRYVIEKMTRFTRH